MRYSITFLLVLLSLNVLAMDKPPQEPVDTVQKPMLITPAEVAQEANRTDSYLKVLPKEIIKVVGQYALQDFEKLDLAIAAIKATTKSATYNQRLINELAKKYNMYPGEVAFMLDPLPMLRQHLKGEVRYKDIFSDDTFWKHYEYEIILKDIQDYLKPLLKAGSQAQREINKHIAIKYLNRFINHPSYSILVDNPFPGEMHGKDRFDKTYYQFVRYLYAIVYGRPDFTFPNFSYETRGVAQDEAVDLNKRLEIALELDKSEEWLKEWTQWFVLERFWSLFIKSLMTHMNNRDTKKVNILINVLAANKGKIKANLKTFLEGQPLWNVKTPSYQEFVSALWDYMEQNGRFEILATIKDFLSLEDFAQLINQQNKNGIYPLVQAIKNKNIRLVRVILEIPGVNLKNCQDGHSLLWHARNFEVDTATRLAIIELLQHAGATEEGVCAVQ